MGNIVNQIWGSLFNLNKQAKILLLGLDSAGKTTIIYQFKLGEQVVAIPTIGFNVEEVKYKNISFTMWDVGGQERIRNMWHHYIDNSDALIFVIDSSDRDRFETCKKELDYLLSREELANASVLIYANKQDLPGAASPHEITQVLGLDRYKSSHQWYVQSSVATRLDGLYEGLDWLSQRMSERK